MVGFKTLIRAAMLTVLLVGVLAACGDDSEPDGPGKSKTLTIASIGDAPPYEFQGDDGKWQGINHDIMIDVFDSAGYSVEYQAMAFAGMLPALSSGRVDMTTILYDTAERRKEADFLDFMQTRFGVLVVASKVDSFQGWPDLCGKRVGAILSNPLEAEVNKQTEEVCTSNGKKKIELVPHPSITQELNDLDNNRLDAIIEDEGVLGHVAQQSPGKYEVAFTTGNPNTFAIGFKKGDPLLEEIKPFLDEYLASEKPAAVAEKWGLRPEVFLKDSTPIDVS